MRPESALGVETRTDAQELISLFGASRFRASGSLERQAPALDSGIVMSIDRTVPKLANGG